MDHKTAAQHQNQFGKVYVEEQKWEEAIACFKLAIQLDSDCAEYQNNLGEILLKQDKLSQAILHFIKATKLNPNSAWYQQNLGYTIAQRQFLPIATECYCQALAIDPEEVCRWKQLHTTSLQADENSLVPNPIFILGCGHSGTSLVLAMLGNHPDFYPIPDESAVLMKSQVRIEKTFKTWDAQCLDMGKKRWIEKTPSHVFYIYRILSFRPNSKLILMLRDGRDVVCSLRYRKEFNTLEKRIDRWIYDNVATLPYWSDPRLKIIKYEDLIEAPQSTLQDIFIFLEEDYSEKVLQFHETQKFWYSQAIVKPDAILNTEDHNTLRNWQINQPLFDGRGRWKTEMTADEKVVFKAKAQQYLEEFGYVNNESW
jgi:hypothetical protein